MTHRCADERISKQGNSVSRVLFQNRENSLSSAPNSKNSVSSLRHTNNRAERNSLSSLPRTWWGPKNHWVDLFGAWNCTFRKCIRPVSNECNAFEASDHMTTGKLQRQQSRSTSPKGGLGDPLDVSRKSQIHKSCVSGPFLTCFLGLPWTGTHFATLARVLFCIRSGGKGISSLKLLWLSLGPRLNCPVCNSQTVWTLVARLNTFYSTWEGLHGICLDWVGGNHRIFSFDAFVSLGFAHFFKYFLPSLTLFIICPPSPHMRAETAAILSQNITQLIRKQYFGVMAIWCNWLHALKTSLGFLGVIYYAMHFTAHAVTRKFQWVSVCFLFALQASSQYVQKTAPWTLHT